MKRLIIYVVLGFFFLLLTGCDGNPVVPTTNFCGLAVEEEIKDIFLKLNISEDPRFCPFYEDTCTCFYHVYDDLKEVIDKEIDPQEIPGLTLRSFILNALYEEELVNSCYPAFVVGEASDYFSKLADNLSNWENNFASQTTKWAILGAIQALGMPTSFGIGISSLFLVIDLLEIKGGIAKLADLIEKRCLSLYLINRSLPPYDHEIAWSISGIPPLYDNWQTESFFQSIWNKYEDAILKDNLAGFKEEQHEMLRELIFQALNQPPNPPTNMIQFKSDGKTILKIGETTTERTVILKAKISDPDEDKVKLQIELRRLDEYGGQFDEDAGGLKQSDLLENNSEVIIPVYGLSDGHYHWRARAIDEYGLSSEWVSFGANPDSAVDFTVLPTSLLTATEIELIRKWGYGGDYVARWPDGYVDVYDATNYSQMQEIINEWNAVIGGPVIFRLSSNPNSPVKVVFDSSLGGLDLCGSGDPVWGDDYAFSEVVIKVNPDEYTCETYNTNTKYCLYLVMFTGVVGFNYGAEVNPTPFEDWSNFNTIPNTIKTMVHALYKVPPGYYLGGSKSKINQSSTIIENMQSGIDTGFASNCKK